MEEKRKSLYALAAIVLLGVALRAVGMNWGLPFEYQSEEYKVVKYALSMGGGSLNPHFFEYPSLYLYFMLFVYGSYFVAGRLFGAFSSVHDFALEFARDPSCFYLLGRFFESFFGIGVVVLTYLVGRKLFSRRAALLASFITAVIREFVNKGHYTKGDMAAIFLGLLFFLFCIKIMEEGGLKYYLLAGASLGLAVSTKYYLLMMGIALPCAHFLNSQSRPAELSQSDLPAGRQSRSHAAFLLSLFLVPVFFFLGTPYALLSAREFAGYFGEHKKIYAALGGETPGYFVRLGHCLKNLLRLHDGTPIFLFGSYGFGLLALAGFVLTFFKKTKGHLLIAAPILAYFLIVAGYHNPAAGYLAPVFPLLAVLAGWGMSEMMERGTRAKAAASALFLLCAASSAGESLKQSILYTWPDTRTLAREWILANVPAGSKILLNQQVNAPPLDPTYGQLEKFYKAAQAANLRKKDYLKLKLEVHPGPGQGYEIYLIGRSAEEIGSLSSQVEEAQKLQDLVNVRGDGNDVLLLRKRGIRCVVESAWYGSGERLERIGRFYGEVAQKGELLKEIEPGSPYRQCPIIRIYKI